MNDLNTFISIISGSITIIGGIYGFMTWYRKWRQTSLNKAASQPPSNVKFFPRAVIFFWILAVFSMLMAIVGVAVLQVNHDPVWEVLDGTFWVAAPVFLISGGILLDRAP